MRFMSSSLSAVHCDQMLVLKGKWRTFFISKTRRKYKVFRQICMWHSMMSILHIICLQMSEFIHSYDMIRSLTFWYEYFPANLKAKTVYQKSTLFCVAYLLLTMVYLKHKFIFKCDKMFCKRWTLYTYYVI